ncbi:MAG: SRPBCC family protein [Acidimicrobiia bacterium]
MPAPFTFDRRFDLRATPEQLWDVLQQTEHYPTWWSWLRELDGGELREGAVARCAVQGPLPYRLRFEITVERVIAHEQVQTRVSGDLQGPARLEIDPGPTGSSARLAWSLDLRDSLLRPLSFVARPAMMWAHDRVIEVGLREFERRALNGS